MTLPLKILPGNELGKGGINVWRQSCDSWGVCSYRSFWALPVVAGGHLLMYLNIIFKQNKIKILDLPDSPIKFNVDQTAEIFLCFCFLISHIIEIYSIITWRIEDVSVVTKLFDREEPSLNVHYDLLNSNHSGRLCIAFKSYKCSQPHSLYYTSDTSLTVPFIDSKLGVLWEPG